MGVIAMKVFGQDQLAEAAPVEKLLAYALSLPVSLASCGMPKVEFIERNVALACDFTPMTGRRAAAAEGVDRGRAQGLHEGVLPATRGRLNLGCRSPAGPVLPAGGPPGPRPRRQFACPPRPPSRWPSP